MKVSYKEQDGVIVVSIDSSVLQENVTVFREKLTRLVNKDNHWIIIDMSEAQYISSLGVSVILEIKKQANNLGGNIFLVNVNHLILNLFKLTNLVNAVGIYDHIDEALNEIKKLTHEKKA